MYLFLISSIVEGYPSFSFSKELIVLRAKEREEYRKFTRIFMNGHCITIRLTGVAGGYKTRDQEALFATRLCRVRQIQPNIYSRVLHHGSL